MKSIQKLRDYATAKDDWYIEKMLVSLELEIDIKVTEVYQKMFQLVGEFDTLKEAKELIKYIKTEEKIKTNKDFKIKQNE